VALLGLDHVQLAAPPGCEDDARRFFGGLLGLEELEKPAALRGRGGCWFALPDGRQLHVGVERPFAAAAKAHPAFRVSDYDALRDRLGGEDDDTIPGTRRFYAADPFGNRLEFVERHTSVTVPGTVTEV
jgi:catechol 2,3-dioxygenase-like lactoylglutathione lyase family enzyme